jgi:electron transfer flavoprotein alpha subunit
MVAEIAVIAELDQERPAAVTTELIAFARALRREPSLPVQVFVLGKGIGPAVRELARPPGVAVTGIESEALARYSAEAWKDLLAPLFAASRPRFICTAHSARGADFAPGLAVRLGAACITAVEAFRREGERVTFIRPLLKGKMRMEIAPEAGMTLITLLPGAFGTGQASAPTGDTERKDNADDTRTEAAAIEIIAAPDIPLKTRPLGALAAPGEATDLAAAEVIVAAGRGVGGEENLILLRRLAACFSRSALGASRAACDAGWLPCRYQIGQTGKSVSPRLYIACGISGAPQHLAGMRGSQLVVAINRDPQAAIFRTADVAVVEEIAAFLPHLTEACRKHSDIPGEGRS